MSFWRKISESLPVSVLCNTEVLAVRRGTMSVEVDIRNSNGDFETMDFDKIIISGAFPFACGSKTYRSQCSDSAGMRSYVATITFSNS